MFNNGRIIVLNNPVHSGVLISYHLVPCQCIINRHVIIYLTSLFMRQLPFVCIQGFGHVISRYSFPAVASGKQAINYQANAGR